MQKMEEAIEQTVIAGKISAAKRKQKQIEQLKQLEVNLSSSDSNERPLNECSANAQQIKENKIKENKNKKIVYYPKIDLDNRNKEEKSEFWENWNKSQVKKQIKTDRLENLNIASRDNQIFD